MRLYYCHTLLYFSFVSFFLLSNSKAVSYDNPMFDEPLDSTIFDHPLLNEPLDSNISSKMDAFKNEWLKSYYDDFKSFRRNHLGRTYEPDNIWSQANLFEDFKSYRDYKKNPHIYKHSIFNNIELILPFALILAFYAQPHLKKLIKKWFYQ